jgi:flagellar biosynthesis/type III secretory pathway protein FliH
MPRTSSLAETFEFGSLEAPAHLIVETGTPEERLRAIAAETRRRAREEGYSEGLAEARAQTASAIDALAAAEQGIRSREEEFLRAAERSAVELAIAIAEKIVGGTVAARPEAVLDVVGGALLRTASRHRLAIEVNPDDLELVAESAEGLAAKLGGVQRLDVVAERRIERGGCIVRTEEGEIDARIGSQLERVAELLAEAGRRRDDAAPDLRAA